MTPTQAFLAAIISGLLGSSAWPVFGPRIVEWKNRKKTEQKRQEVAAEKRKERERDQWMEDAEDAYKRVQGECASCRKELAALRRELGEVKEALLGRIEALDEILPYITNLPDEKIRKIRSTNRAQRQAVFKGRP